MHSLLQGEEIPKKEKLWMFAISNLLLSDMISKISGL